MIADTVHPKPKPVKKPKNKKSGKKALSCKQYWERRADNLVREIVLLRDCYCVCPPPKNGHSNVMQPGHLITRGRKYVRWSLINIHCQCSSCNLLHEHFSEIYTKWFIVEFGKDVYIELVNDSGRIANLKMDEMRTLCAELGEILEYQKEHPNWRPYFKQVDILSGAWKKLSGEENDGSFCSQPI